MLNVGNAEAIAEIESRLLTPLSELGWREGSNLSVERLPSEKGGEELLRRAEELARRGVDVIVTGGPPTTMAAYRATQTIPIVFQGVHYPVEQGFVQSLARPGGNITGPALFPNIDVSIKSLQLLQQAMPGVRRVAWVWPQQNLEPPKVDGGVHDMRPALLEGAQRLGLTLRIHCVRYDQVVENLFGEILEARPEALRGSVFGQPETVTRFALEHRLPSVYPLRYWTAAGGLFSYGPTESDMATAPARAARYIDRILRGARPAELPVELPDRYELVLNRGTARALGFVFPRDLLLLANEIIG
jgi:putative ABC transport system substrate-binding protein